MAEYIERENAIAWFMPYEHAGESIDADVVISDIKGMTAADVAPVRHGRIVTTTDRWAVMHQSCSEGGSNLPWNEYPNYCFNCGVKLDLEETCWRGIKRS